MSALRQRAEEYLKMRRSLGYKLLRQGSMLLDFIGYLEHAGASTVTIEAAVAWATQPAGAAPRPRSPPHHGGDHVKPAELYLMHHGRGFGGSRDRGAVLVLGLGRPVARMSGRRNTLAGLVLHDR